MVFRWRVVVSLLLTVLWPALGWAQTSATVVGQTVDATGARLPGVLVTATQTETGLARTATSDVQGRFTFAGLPAGDYRFRAELTGFRTVVRTGIRLSVAEQASLTLTLQVGAAEAVTVTGSHRSSILEALSSVTSSTARTIEQMPINGRNYTDLMALQPGGDAVSAIATTDRSSRTGWR